MAEAFRQILETLVRDPDARVSSVPLPAGEMARLRERNATVADYPRESTIALMFERQAARTPDAPAASHGAETISYRDLDVRANRIAHVLRGRGVGRGSVVGLALTRSIDMVAAVLGVAKAGGTYLPLDPALPAARLAFMVKDSGLSIVVSESAHAAQHGVGASSVLELDRAREELASTPAGPVDGDVRSARPEDAAYLLYTSGSTGKPKGVLVHHRAAINVLTAVARQPGCTEKDRWLAVTTLSFDIALLELFVPLFTGGQVVIASREDASDAAAIQRLLDTHAITILQATPATWRMLVDAGWAGRPGMKAITGGEALAPDLAAALVPRVAELWNLYGPTETTVYSTGVRIVDPGAGITIGRPFANTSVWVLDPRRSACPIGVVGEIYIGGDGVALGYHGRPDLTAERFLPDPFGWGPGSRLYRTGDLGRLRDDGLVEYLGRADFQVKIRGFRIELGEIEACLAEHPGVREVCVAVVESVAGDPAIVAYFATRPDQTVTSTDLRSQCRADLPDYMVPRSFVELPALPLTPNGKVDRKALPAASHATAPAEATIAPRTASERLVADVWKELLGRDVGVNENFFEAGGHSLLVVRAIGAIAKRSGVQLSPRVFAVDTLAQIAAPIEARIEAPRPRVEAPPTAPQVQPSGLLTRLKNRILG
jgi:amino acid adenylation domain-containing protein